ncbi:MAG: hypothetical protein AAGU11_17855 [Syntrophobacteraceae bacterium]
MRKRNSLTPEEEALLLQLYFRPHRPTIAVAIRTLRYMRYLSGLPVRASNSTCRKLIEKFARKCPFAAPMRIGRYVPLEGTGK